MEKHCFLIFLIFFIVLLVLVSIVPWVSEEHRDITFGLFAGYITGVVADTISARAYYKISDRHSDEEPTK